MEKGARRGIAALACALAVLLFGQPAAGAESGPAADPHGGRIQFLRALIEESSAAKRVAGSGNAEAIARRDQARMLHAQALAAHEAGDHVRADALLGQAARLMFEAVRLAEKHGNVQTRKESDFDSRMSSVESLAGAFERICDEKKCETAVRAEVRASVDGRVREARALRAAGDIERARLLLDEAYVAMKVAIEHQRGGDTLVRSLHFKTKEEEYRYELDRNDTHRMLITLFLENKARGPHVPEMQKFLDRAAALRAQAEQEAISGRYESAIELLEGSTRELQQALRGAGIYIPG